MGLIKRTIDAMESLWIGLLDKIESPEYMLEQRLMRAAKERERIRSNTERVIAEENYARRMLDQCKKDVMDCETYAKRAVEMGRDDAAIRFLNEEETSKQQMVQYQKALDVATENSVHMIELKKQADMQYNALMIKKSELKAQIMLNETKRSLMRSSECFTDVINTDAFRDAEEKIYRLSDSIAAKEMVNRTDLDIFSLRSSIDSEQKMVRINERLAQIKADMAAVQ